MQTFLPYASFKKSARVLDNRRLGKQRVEALTILKIITERSKGGGWKSHPAVLMWASFPEMLGLYLNCCISEWERRGKVNNMECWLVEGWLEQWPWWLGREELHASHRANLLRKDPAFYGKYGWTEDPSTPYWWPTKHYRD